jgi:DNA end-binding protein Ku
MARAIWKGVIRFEDVEVPVKLYSAVGGGGVHFRLLHAKDEQPVQQRMVNPETGDVVPYDRIRRGYEVEPGVFVMLDAAELEALEPTASRDIEITRFLPAGTIGHHWYDRPYFLGPDGDDDAYFSLAAALSEQEKEGVARWVMRKKEYVGALRLEGDYLLLATLRHAGEVVSPEALPAPGGRAPDKREIAMAKQLVGALEDDFDLEDWQDEYSKRVMELIEAKSRGEKVEKKRPRRKKTTKSLADSLAASIRKAKEKKVA